MTHIIFDMLLLLGNIWVASDEDNPMLLKRLAVLAIIFLTVSIMMQSLILVCNGNWF